MAHNFALTVSSAAEDGRDGVEEEDGRHPHCPAYNVGGDQDPQILGIELCKDTHNHFLDTGF